MSDRLAVVAGLALGAAASAVQLVDPSQLLNYLAGSLGLFALHERLRSEFAPWIGVIATLVMFAGTSVMWSMTHDTSGVVFIFAATAILVWRAPSMSPRVRTHVVLWTTLAILPVAFRLWQAWDYAGTRLPLTDSLFSSARGLLSLTPVSYVALVGTVAGARRVPRSTIASLGVFLLWVLSVWWWPAPGDTQPFGHGLTPALALLAPGLARVIQMSVASPIVAIAPLLAFVILWNYELMVQYTAGTVPKDAPVSFAALVRQQADVHTRAPYAYPFALPVNAIFSWHHGVPADRYDVLSRITPTPRFELALDRRADPFLLDGWGGTVTTSALGPGRWTNARRSSLLLPVASAASSTDVRITAYARQEEPAVSVELAVVINGTEVGRIVAGPAAGETVVRLGPGAPLRSGYNQLTFINRGVQRVFPADPSPLGPLASRAATIPFPVAIHRISIVPGS